MKGYNGRQRETRPSGKRAHHATQGNKKRGTMGDRGRQDSREGGHTIQQRETKRGTMGDKEDKRPSARRTHHPSKGNKEKGGTMGDKGRQDPRESELTMQHRETRKGVQWETEGDKTRGKADTPSNKGKQKGVQWETKKTSDPLQGGRTIHQKETRKKGVQWETKGDKTLAKADTPSNKGKEEKGVQWETNKGRRTHHPAKGNKKRGTMGDKGRQDPSGRRAHHPTEGYKKGYNGRQRETRLSGRRAHHPTKGSTILQRETRRSTMGEKGRQDPQDTSKSVAEDKGEDQPEGLLQRSEGREAKVEEATAEVEEPTKSSTQKQKEKNENAKKACALAGPGPCKWEDCSDTGECSGKPLTQEEPLQSLNRTTKEYKKIDGSSGGTPMVRLRTKLLRNHL